MFNRKFLRILLAIIGLVFLVGCPPRINKLSSTSGCGGEELTLVGSGFGETQGTSNVLLDGVVYPHIISWSDTEIVIPAPEEAGNPTLPVVALYAKVNNQNSNIAVFTVTPPAVTITSPAEGSFITTDSVDLNIDFTCLNSSDLAVELNGEDITHHLTLTDGAATGTLSGLVDGGINIIKAAAGDIQDERNIVYSSQGLKEGMTFLNDHNTYQAYLEENYPPETLDYNISYAASLGYGPIVKTPFKIEGSDKEMVVGFFRKESSDNDYLTALNLKMNNQDDPQAMVFFITRLEPGFFQFIDPLSDTVYNCSESGCDMINPASNSSLNQKVNLPPFTASICMREDRECIDRWGCDPKMMQCTAMAAQTFASCTLCLITLKPFNYYNCMTCFAAAVLEEPVCDEALVCRLACSYCSEFFCPRECCNCCPGNLAAGCECSSNCIVDDKGMVTNCEHELTCNDCCPSTLREGCTCTSEYTTNGTCTPNIECPECNCCPPVLPQECSCTVIACTDTYCGREITCGNDTNDPGESYEDPVIITFDGNRYYSSYIGEFVLVRNKSLNGFEVQTRQIAGDFFRDPCAAINSSVAVRINENNVLEFKLGYANERLLLNGQTISLESGAYRYFDEGGYIGWTIHCYRWAGGFYCRDRVPVLEIMDKHGNIVKIRQESLQTVFGGGNFLQVEASIRASEKGNIEGLLGNADGDPGNDYMLRNGQLSEDLNAFIENWRITDEESLFTYEPGQGTGDFSEFRECAADNTLASTADNHTKQAIPLKR